MLCFLGEQRPLKIHPKSRRFQRPIPGQMQRNNSRKLLDRRQSNLLGNISSANRRRGRRKRRGRRGRPKRWRRRWTRRWRTDVRRSWQALKGQPRLSSPSPMRTAPHASQAARSLSGRRHIRGHLPCRNKRALSGPVLRDTARLSQRYPPIARYGFLVSQHGQLGAIPPPPFLSISTSESMQSGGAIPPPQKGISAILARYPMKTRQMGAIPPTAILSRKGIARYGGGISHWAAKNVHMPMIKKLQGVEAF